MAQALLPGTPACSSGRDSPIEGDEKRVSSWVVDFADAKRILKRLRSDDLKSIYVPEAEQRDWRSISRYRKQLIEDRVRVRNRLEGVLEESCE